MVKGKQTAQLGNIQESYTHHNTQIHAQIKERKIFFIVIKVQLITISSVIPYISEIICTSSSLKKKSQERERKREREEERVRKERRTRWEREGKGEGKRGRENEKNKEKEKKEEKEEEEKKMEKAVLRVHRSLQTHALARS